MTAFAFFLRLGRWGTAGFSLIALVTTLLQSVAFYRIAGRSLADRAAFGQSITAIGSHFTAVFPPPVRPDTVGGYVEWRGFSALALLLSIWAVASATAMVRIDEERGVIEAALAAGTPRAQLVLTRSAAFVVAVSIASTATAIGFIAGVALARDSFDTRAVIEASMLLALLALSCYGLSMLLAQLFAARGATAVTAVVMLSLFLLNSLSRTYPSLLTVSWISPFRYYDLNQPLAPGGAFDTGSAFVLGAIFAAATAAAAAAFALRDIGAPLLPIPRRRPRPSLEQSTAPWWRVAVLRELYASRLGLLTWCAGLAVLGIVFVFATKTALQPLLSVPTLFPNFGAALRQNIFPAALGFTWFNLAELLFAGYAIAQVARWSAEDVDGRLEALLSQPRSRAGVVLERMVVLMIGAALIATVSGVAVYYAANSQDVGLNAQRVAVATSMLVPIALVFAAAGGLLAALNPRAAVGVLGAIAFFSFLDSEIGPPLKFPAWLQDLSAFKLFGTPMTSGLDGRNLALLLLLSALGLGSSILLMQRRDVGA
jgi:putative exporter of polyketide antibiotics